MIVPVRKIYRAVDWVDDPQRGRDFLNRTQIWRRFFRKNLMAWKLPGNSRADELICFDIRVGN